MMTSNVDRMVEAALNRAGRETLVNRLRQMDRGYPTILSTAADKIEQLERELAEVRESLRIAVKSADLADAAIDTAWNEAIEAAAQVANDYDHYEMESATRALHRPT